DAVTYFESALGRLVALPDTQANRLRRIDAVVGQAEVKLALGRLTEHIEALEGIRDLVEASADPPRRAAWCYWTGHLHSFTGWRPGSTHIQRGDPAAGLQCCDEALALSPAPFDAAVVKSVRGYGLVKAGQVPEGIAVLHDALTWLDRSHLRYTRSMTALRLADGYLRAGEPGRARELLEGVLTTSRDIGYRYLEAMAGRLLGGILGGE